MRLPFRKKDKKRDGPTSPVPAEFHSVAALNSLCSPPSQLSARILARLPREVMVRIFTAVCPQALDETYETCEESAKDEGCMLCDVRDLSHCTQVNRPWRRVALGILYHSVRIDPVHYCRMEAFLAEQRKKKSRFNKNGIPEDPALARLKLLRRTVRDDPTGIGRVVEFLKTPYMIRESCHVELAQTIAVLPRLKYVDLPEGMFCDDPAYTTLRLEVQARCPGIRKTTYANGAEHSFAALVSGQIWQELEVLELTGLKIEPQLLRAALSCLSKLRALKVSETYSLSDEVLAADEDLPILPALEELILKDTPSLTSAGLMDYLSTNETQQALKVLTLKDTGIQPWRLQEVLDMGPSLKTLAIQSKVSQQFPSNEPIQLLAHKGLRTLRYEISGASSAGPFATQGYYSYLSNSVLAGNLPRLRRVYVLDEQFPQQLQNLPPPMANFAGGRVRTSSNPPKRTIPSVRVSPPDSSSPLTSPTRQGFGSLSSPARPRFGNVSSPTRKDFSNMASPVRQNFSSAASQKRLSSNNPFAQAAGGLPPTQTLEIFTKSNELGQWNFSRVDSFTGAAAGPPRRPTSSYGLDADVAGQDWDRGEARRSIMIRNGANGFSPMAADGEDGGVTFGPVPIPGGADPLTPRSSAGDVRRSRGMGSR
ncbi:F-box domain protein [Metarhizium album ARSEF 1941]|uniref:F-box domain protein n=1 Tax=Metarhizium album (strain ARSEF 1941) TaxID=1081103 RepID=A0A0B2X6Y0_METAS|nr:F-box domain protein [Metarhizium album ARSEF 1941]KHO01528.1 F-box domain protein [Metarhizium album ARSEF 1941]